MIFGVQEGDNMKKILLLSNMYPSKKFPHYGIFVKNTENILIENNYIVKKVVIKKNDRKMIKLMSYFIYFFKSFFIMLIKKNDYIYVHYPSLSGIPVLVANLFKRQNIIINIHGNDLVPENKKDHLFLSITLKLSKCASKVIVPSEYFKKIIVEKKPSVYEKVVVFPSGGVDSNTFNKIDKNVSLGYLGLDKCYQYIGYIGRIEPSKGWNVFLDMVNEIKDPCIKFIVVGSGTEDIKYEKKVKELDLSDRIIKFDLLSQQEINYIFNALDIFVFPTFRKSESLGLVGLEAMSTNAILLSSDNYGPTSYIVDGVNGFLFKSKNVESLVSEIYKILSMSESELEMIRNNAEITLQDFSIKKLSKKLVSSFEGDK
jgi:glycosyltransferase involved in cell wall biosynthesis